MKIKSYAKINLFLEILGKNQENYHILESLMCFLDIFDDIQIQGNQGLKLEFRGQYADFLKNDKSENIILKTVNFMAKKYNFEPNLYIILDKKIPIGAGLGGGSANCASIILAVNEIYNLGLKPDELMEIGLKMGCDVPICLNQKVALVEGVGDKITQIDGKFEDLFVLIVNPNKFLSTKAAFDELGCEDYVDYSTQELQAKHNPSTKEFQTPYDISNNKLQANSNALTHGLQSQCTTPDSRKLEEAAKETRSTSCRSKITKDKADAFCVNRQQKTAVNLGVASVLETKSSVFRLEPAGEIQQKLIQIIKPRQNHLENPAKKLLPEISTILDKISNQKNCLLSRMSGSGATCFGLFDNGDDLNLAYENFKQEFPDFFLRKSQLIYDKNEKI